MKKKILLILCAVMGTFVFAGSFKKNQTVYVSAKSAVLKKDSGNFAKDAGTVTYGDQLKVLSVSGKKVQVQLVSNTSISGWIAEGSLTTKKIVKSSSGKKVSASAKELALAGKGFSEESEDVYKAAHENLDFDLVDSIEAIVISNSDMEKFISEGHLLGAE